MSKSLDHLPETLPKSLPTEKYIENQRRLHTIKIFGANAALLTLAVGFPYSWDVLQNQQKEKLSEPSIETIYQARDDAPSDAHSLIFFNGFDTIDAEVMATKLGPLFQDIQELSPGKIKSVNLGDAPLNIKDLARRIAEDTKNDGEDTVSLGGNSLGTIVALEVTDELIKNYDINVELVYLNAPPDGINGLKAGTQHDLAVLMEMLSLIPESEYSTGARVSTTIALESSRIFDDDSVLENISDFFEVQAEAFEQVQNNTRPGMWLVADQALALANADGEGTVTNIGENSMKIGEMEPTLLISVPEDSEDDIVVDTEKSKNFCKYAGKVGISCFVMNIDHSPHTSYNFNTQGISNALQEYKYAIEHSVELNRKTLATSGKRLNQFYADAV